MAREVRPPKTAVDRSRARVERLRKAAGKTAGKPRAVRAEKATRAQEPPALTEPPCAECGLASSLVGGAVIYPHREDLHGRWFWRCPRCEPAAYVGCHRGGDGRQALGRPAGPYLRRARGKLHELVDALWERAEAMACYHPFTGNVWQVRSRARVRVYQYIRVHMRLAAHEAHIAWFDLEQCRAAWRLLQNVDGGNIRDWAHNMTAEEEAFLA